MFVNAKLVDNLSKAFVLITKSSNTDIRQGEEILRQMRTSTQYPFTLLHYISNPQSSLQNKRQAAIEIRLWYDMYLDQYFGFNNYVAIMESLLLQLISVYMRTDDPVADYLRSAVMSRMQFMENHISILTEYLRPNHNAVGPSELCRVLRLLNAVYKNQDMQSEQIEILTKVLLDVLLQRMKTEGSSMIKLIRYQCMKLLERCLYYYYDLVSSPESTLLTFGVIADILRGDQSSLSENQQLIFKTKGKALQVLSFLSLQNYESFDADLQRFVNQIWNKYRTDPKYAKYCLQYFANLLRSSLWKKISQGTNVDNMIRDLLQVVVVHVYDAPKMLKTFRSDVNLFYQYYYMNVSGEEDRREMCRRVLNNILRKYPDIWQNVVKIGVEHADPSTRSVMLQFMCESNSHYYHFDTYQHKPEENKRLKPKKSSQISKELIADVYLKIVRPHFFDLYGKVTGSQKLALSDSEICDLLSEMRYVYYFCEELGKDEASICGRLFSQLAIKIPGLTRVTYSYLKRLALIHFIQPSPGILSDTSQPIILFKSLIQDANTNCFQLELEDYAFISIVIQGILADSIDLLDAELKAIALNILELAKEGNDFEILESALKVPEVVVTTFGLEREFCPNIIKLIDRNIINKSSLVLYQFYLTSEFCNNPKSAVSLFSEMSDPNYWSSNLQSLDVLIPLYVVLVQVLGGDPANVKRVFEVIFQHIRQMIAQNQEAKLIQTLTMMVEEIPDHIQRTFCDELLYQTLFSMQINYREKVGLLVKAAIAVMPSQMSTRMKLIDTLGSNNKGWGTKADIQQNAISLIFDYFDVYFMLPNSVSNPNKQYDWEKWANILTKLIQNTSSYKISNTHCNRILKEKFMAFCVNYKPDMQKLINTKMQIKLSAILEVNYN